MATPHRREQDKSEAQGRAEAARAVMIEDCKPVFDRLRKSLKQVSLYKHNTDRYGEYLEPFVTALQGFLEKNPTLALKVDPDALRIHTTPIFEDDGRENNVIFPLWQAGVRLLMFKQGVSADELQRFFLICMSAMEDVRRGREDIVTQLWKAELQYVEYVVVEGFKAVPEDDLEDVEIEVEKVVAYLYRQLQSNSDDYLRFARVTAEDLDLKLENVDQSRAAIIKGRTATEADKARVQATLQKEETRHLQKLVTVLFQLLELDTNASNFEDVAEAFVQLLDALVLMEQFGSIHQIRMRFLHLVGKPGVPSLTRALVQQCSDRFTFKMAETQRIATIGQILNNGIAKDPDGVRAYLAALNVEAIIPLLDTLEQMQLPPNRRLICDVLVELGRDHVDTFVQRFTHPSSNFVKDMIYIVDKMNPPNKFELFAGVLQHQNAILRLETLAIIGRSGANACFPYISETATVHPDPQMRAQAIRLLPNFAADAAGNIVIGLFKDDVFDKLSAPEKKALGAALVQVRTPATEAVLRQIFETKGGLFSKRVDEQKVLAIQGLESAPSVPGFQLLAAVAQDPKTHSKEVCEAAKAAALAIKAKLLGG